MKAILIPQDPILPICRLDVDEGLEPLQSLVGGMIQHIPHQSRDDITPWINEEGKYVTGCLLNQRATAWFNSFGGLFTGDYISGNMIVTGSNPKTGESRDVPDGLFEELVKLAVPA